jgi:hypothetical protein
MSNIKNIQTVAPFLADDFVDLDHEIFDVDKYYEFVHEKRNKLGLFSKYLVCKLHDSWVIETNLTDNQFSITLNDFSTYVIADAIIQNFALPIKPDEISFPLTLSFDTNGRKNYCNCFSKKYFRNGKSGICVEETVWKYVRQIL